VDISRDGFVTHDSESEAEEKPGNEDASATVMETKTEGEKDDATTKKRPWTKENPNKDRSKRKKKRNFRYESKADRRMTRAKERSRNSSKAKARRGD